MKSRKKKLRTGFTTGTAAAAAAKAAVLFLGGINGLKTIDTPLPSGGRLQIPVASVKREHNGASALVIKDAGDDPDVTHRAKIWCRVGIDKTGPSGQVLIEGGRGVGRVTKPGLPVAVGESAINPEPRKQITEAVREALQEANLEGSVTVTVHVPRGEEIARKTLNPRLGIMGGISILGTRGTVLPFSHQAYKDTITLAMDVARARSLDTIVLSTGGRSERLAGELLGNMPEEAFVQVADFFEFSLKEAARRGFKHIILSCFFGKLVKMAQGCKYTHARKSSLDLQALSGWCLEEGMPPQDAKKVAIANTAIEALGIILEADQSDKIISRVLQEALRSAKEYVGPGPSLEYLLFSMQGELLGKMTDSQLAYKKF
ncbi:MAG TPA: cobalt-precorrin-5B (C(1))-methyltransferase [Deltaproteobacteria bacterium]|nr:cobalt-precorrin-5B (C(1))-methyltransferase [Deltaproteobacteria bacterium]